MGWFSSLCSGISSGVKKVASTVKKGADWVGEKCKNGATKVKEAVTNVWSSFTGEKIAKEAKEIYERARKRYGEKKLEFENKIKDLTKEVNQIVKEINNKKVYIYSVLMKDFIKIFNKIHDGKVTSKEKLDEEYTFSGFNPEEIKSIENVMKIDFDKNRFSTNLKAILTLGFHTRKKAKESKEEAVKTREQVNLNIAKMDTEIVRVTNMRDSLQNINHFFTQLTEIFEDMLKRLSFSLSMLKNIYLVFSYKIMRGKYDIRKLPKAQFKTFKSAHTMVTVLKEMCKRTYIDVEKCDVIEDDIKKTESQFNEFMKANTVVA